jgi:hypothetical protein
MSFHRATIEDFWREVTIGSKSKPDWGECWTFKGSNAFSGYRAFRSVLAHRAAATIYCGRIPARVSQRCGNRHCVRLEHLQIASEPKAPIKFNPYTGQPIRPKRSEEPDLIKSVMESRPADGERYSIDSIAKKLNVTKDTVRKILREAALYDLMMEYQSENGKVQMKPNEELANVAS